jgi:polyhydroxyalkanoate synthesis repressor PhaR
MVATVETSGEDRLIKRYDNRKLYDTFTRAYVTLEELAAVVSGGNEVRVVDQRSGEDITTVVLAQVVLEGLKARSAEIPRQVLTRLIRFGFAAKQQHGEAAARHEPASRAREEAERIVTDLIRRGRLPLEDALALRQEIFRSVSRAASEAQRSLENRFHSLMEWTERERGVSPAMGALRERLMTLESYLGAAKPSAARSSRGRPGGVRRPAARKTPRTHS